MGKSLAVVRIPYVWRNGLLGRLSEMGNQVIPECR